MKFINTLQNPILKAVAALANNGGLFKKRVKAAFNPKITLGFNFFTNSQKMILNYCPCTVSRAQRFPGHNVMKAFVMLSVIAFSFTSCKKDIEIAPKAAPSASKASASSTTSTPASPVKASTDTIADNAAFKIQLGKDSVNTDQTLIMFNHNASLNYSSASDAPYLSGFGKVSLANVSHDGVDIAIKSLPYTTGMSIALDVRVKTDGTYFLTMPYQNNIPSSIKILLMDSYLKDSVDVRSKNYTFNITKADTNSFGRKRFKLVLKNM